MPARFGQARFFAAGCMLVFLPLACQGPNDAEPTMSTDTIGSVIVTRNSGISSASAPTMRLEQVVELGARDTSAALSFGRIAAVALDGARRIHVLDAASRNLRTFDTTGTLVRTVGREGTGPGEFQAPYAVAIDRQGRIWVADDRARAYTIFDSSGKFLETKTKPTRRGPNPAVRFGNDGSIYEFGQSEGGHWVVRIPAGDALTVADTVFLPEFLTPAFELPPGPGERFTQPIPFSPRQVATVGPDGRVWTGTGATYTIAEIRGRGDTVRRIMLDVAPAELTAAEKRRADSLTTRAESLGFVVNRSRIPKTQPHISGIHISTNGEIWVRRASADMNAPRPDVFDVFDAHGRYIGTVPAPVDANPAPWISDRHVLGVQRDSSDVPCVVLLRIVRQ